MLFNYSTYYGLAVAVEQGSKSAGGAGVVVEIIYARLFIDPYLRALEGALRIDLFKTFFSHHLFLSLYIFAAMLIGISASAVTHAAAINSSFTGR